MFVKQYALPAKNTIANNIKSGNTTKAAFPRPNVSNIRFAITYK